MKDIKLAELLERKPHPCTDCKHKKQSFEATINGTEHCNFCDVPYAILEQINKIYGFNAHKEKVISKQLCQDCEHDIRVADDTYGWLVAECKIGCTQYDSRLPVECHQWRGKRK